MCVVLDIVYIHKIFTFRYENTSNFRNAKRALVNSFDAFKEIKNKPNKRNNRYKE